MALARLLATLQDDKGNVAVEGVCRFVARRTVHRGGSAVERGHPRRPHAHRNRSSRRPPLGPPLHQRHRSGHDEHRRVVQRPDPGGQRQALDADRAGYRPEHPSWTSSSPICSRMRPGAKVEVNEPRRRPRSVARRTVPATPLPAGRWSRHSASRWARPGPAADPAPSHCRRRPPGQSSSSGARKTCPPRIHASDESVDPAEIERLVVAQACYCSGSARRRPPERPALTSGMRSS